MIFWRKQKQNPKGVVLYEIYRKELESAHCLYFTEYCHILQWKLWKYQKGNQKPQIEWQTIQWPKRHKDNDRQYNGQKDLRTMTDNTMAKKT